jgi:hypothetical protein
VIARLRADGEGSRTGGRAVGRAASPRAATGRHLAVAAAAAAVAGMVAGATFVGIGGEPRSPAAADLPARVVAAQHDIQTVDSRFVVTEHPPAGSSTGAASGRARALEGHLVYRAPESLSLTVSETTSDRPGTDEGSGGRLVVDRDRWWQETVRQCSPAAGLVRCPDRPDTWVRSVTGREPFSEAAPIPLELVSPVDSFTLSAAPADLGDRTIAGRRAMGVTVTAAQVAPLVEGLSSAVELRPVHPSDPVELWLDDEHLVPLDLVVRAADDPGRARWAAAIGADEGAGDVILSVTTTAVQINENLAGEAFDVPDVEPSAAADGGFRSTPPGATEPATPGPRHLPDGFRAHRSGTVTTPGGPAVAVRSWSDGRAWLTVRATTAWSERRLFGDLGLDVRPVDLGDAGVAYLSGDGRRIGVHTAHLDAVVSGSLPADDLRAIAADLDVVGQPVPTDWAEAATATLDDAAAVVPMLLTDRAAEGFSAPAVRLDGDTVTQVYAGPGTRGFALTQRPSPSLPPPSSGDEIGLDVRGTTGRYSQQRGEVEWVEGGSAVSLRSDTLGLAELLTIAGHLEPA